MTEPDNPQPKLTRRQLVQIGGASVAVWYLGGPAARAAAAGEAAHLRRASYTGLKGTRFAAVTPGGAPVTLRMTAVGDLVRARSEPSLRGHDDAFALTFTGPATIFMESGISRLQHPTLGWVSLFISPAGPTTTTQSYEVVVDRSGR
jgi:hypothetical protein